MLAIARVRTRLENLEKYLNLKIIILSRPWKDLKLTVDLEKSWFLNLNRVRTTSPIVVRQLTCCKHLGPNSSCAVACSTKMRSRTRCFACNNYWGVVYITSRIRDVTCATPTWLICALFSRVFRCAELVYDHTRNVFKLEFLIFLTWKGLENTLNLPFKFLCEPCILFCLSINIDYSKFQSRSIS